MLSSRLTALLGGLYLLRLLTYRCGSSLSRIVLGWFFAGFVCFVSSLIDVGVWGPALEVQVTKDIIALKSVLGFGE